MMDACFFRAADGHFLFEHLPEAMLIIALVYQVDEEIAQPAILFY